MDLRWGICMGLLKTIIVCVFGYASAGMYVLGGLGMASFSDDVTFSTDTTNQTIDANSGELSTDIRIAIGYQPKIDPVNFSSMGYFGEFGMDIMTKDSEYATVGLTGSGSYSSTYTASNKDSIYFRAGSMFRAADNVFPYVQGVYVVDLSTDYSITGSTTLAKDSMSSSGMGAGLGIRAFAGKTGFYDFNYLYLQTSENDATVGSDTLKSKPTLGVFVASIGHMFG